MAGTDARDWIRGLRPWDQFLTYCVTIAQTPGTQLYAAQLNDDRYLPEFEKLLDQQAKAGKTATIRPALRGHSRLVEAIYLLANEVRAQTRLLAKVDMRPIEGPVTPADRIRARNRDMRMTKIANLLKGG